MALTETLAATAAQTIPVFALAGVIEARASAQAPRTPQRRTSDSDLRDLLYLMRGTFKTLWVLTLFAIGTTDVTAEVQCLLYLSGRHVAKGTDILVIWAMAASLVLLAVFPLLSAVSAIQWNVLKSGPPEIRNTRVGRLVAKLAGDDPDADTSRRDEKIPDSGDREK